MKSKIVFLLLTTSAVFPASVYLPSPASAAEAASSLSLEEIVVTARKREERLRDVPDSITALTSLTIERSGIGNVKDVAFMVPNFSIVETQQPGTEAINIRGIGQVRNGEPPVAVIIDGVQLSSAYQITQDLFDVERIEVLKGPQGAVYGRNAIGGAINITTKRPGNDLEGQVKLGYGSGDDLKGSAVISGPLVEDKLLFRVAGSFRDFDGDIDNVLLDEKVNKENAKNIRANVIAHLSETVTADIRYSRMDTEAGAAWYAFVPPGVSANEVLPVNADILGQADRVLNDASAKIDVETDGVTITSITAYSKVYSGLYEDFDFTPADFLHGEQYLRQEAWSEELRLTSNGDGPLKWLVGAYYLDTNRKLDSEIYIHPGASFVLAPFAIPAPMLFAATRSTDNNKAYAVFGHAAYRVQENIELAAGLRYDIDDRDQTDRVTTERFQKKFKALQPKFQATYFLNDDAMAYASVGRGFRSGGFNPSDRIVRVFDKETNWNYEIGAKLGFADNRVLMNAAVFYTRVDDRQVYNFDLISGAQVISNPIPKADIKGLEFDVTARVAEGFDLQGSIGLLDTEIKKYDTSYYVGLPVAGDYTGNKLPQTPSFSYAFAAQYEFSPMEDLIITSRVDVNGYGGSFYWEIDNLDKREDITLVNARLTAEYGNVALTGYVTNLFKERYNLEYVSQAFSGSPFGNYSMPAPDRRYGVEARYRF